MSRKKLILNILLVITLLFPMSAPAFAAGSGPGTITVTPPSSGNLILNTDDFKAYKLFDVTVSLKEGTSPQEYNYAYMPVPEVTAFLASAFGSDYRPDLKAWLEEHEDDLAALTQLTKDLDDFGGFTAIDAVPDTPNVKFTDLDYGYYLVTGSGKTGDGATVVAHSALVTVDEFFSDPVIKIKADAPKIEKKVKAGQPSTAHTDTTDFEYRDSVDVNIGEKADFMLSTAVPAMEGYDSYTFIIHDTLSNGLTLDASSIKVYMPNTMPVNSQWALYGPAGFVHPTSGELYPDKVKWDELPDTAYSVNVNGQSFSIEFSDFIQYAEKAGYPIVVTYSAVLNEDAVVTWKDGGSIINGGGNPNDVWLEYSNNPYTDGKGETPKDTVIVYTYELDVHKYGVVDGEDTAFLGGAKFALYVNKNNTLGQLFTFTGPVSDGEGNNVYTVCLNPPEGVTTTTEMVTPDGGDIKIIGLDAGEYYLVETGAPDGFNKLQQPIKVSISMMVFGPDSMLLSYNFTDPNRTSTTQQSGGFVVASLPLGTDGTVNVENNSGVVFPGTGGIGRTIFILSGSVLMLGALAAMFIRRRTEY